MSTIKKILVVGVFNPNPNIYTYATSFYKTFQELGYEVEAFNYRKKYVSIKKINDYFCNSKLIKTVSQFNPDLVFFIKAENIYPKTIKKIKDKFNILITNFYPDNPFVFSNGNSNSNVLNSLPFYDCFLAWSKMLMPALESAGCQKVYYLPFGYDQDLFSKKIELTNKEKEKYSSDVCFIGTWEQDREKWLTQLHEKMPNLKLAIWGNMWEENLHENSILRKKLRGNAIYGTQMRKAFNCSKIVLNFIRKQNMTSANMRTFEVPANRSFLLTERTYEQAELLFKEGESIECFDSIEELIKKVKFYIENDSLRESIIKNSFNKVQDFKLQSLLQEFMKNFL